MKNIYFNINDLDNKNIHFIIGGKQYGKTYYQCINKIRKELKSLEKIYIDSIRNIKLLNNYTEEEYPPIYYMNKGAVELIQYLIKEVLK